MIKNEKWTKLNMKVSDLSLWDENARFPDKYFNKDEPELISYFCSKPVFKILETAKSIVRDFDLPQIEKIIVYKTDDQNVVIEGNRRLTIYKLLIDPDKAPDEKTRQTFKELKSKIAIDENYELECELTEDLNEGYRIIDRKHLQGNNEVAWGDVERTHHKIRRGNATSRELVKIALTKVIRSLSIPDEVKEKVLGKGYVTTLWRILNYNPAWEEFGYELDNGELSIKDKEFPQKLKAIIKHVLEKRDTDGRTVDSRSLNKTQEIENYLKSITREKYEKIEFGQNKEQLTKEKSTTGGKSAPSRPAKSSKSKPIPKGLFNQYDLPYGADSSSLRILYDELRTMPVDDFPNAAHNLLRTFLECSLIVFFKKNGDFNLIQKHDTHKPTLDEMLSHIVARRCKRITDESLIQTISHVKSEWGQPYSLQRLNMVHHNENWNSAPKDVRSAWAKLEPLFKLILSKK